MSNYASFPFGPLDLQTGNTTCHDYAGLTKRPNELFEYFRTVKLVRTNVNSALGDQGSKLQSQDLSDGLLSHTLARILPRRNEESAGKGQPDRPKLLTTHYVMKGILKKMDALLPDGTHAAPLRNHSDEVPMAGRTNERIVAWAHIYNRPSGSNQEKCVIK